MQIQNLDTLESTEIEEIFGGVDTLNNIPYDAINRASTNFFSSGQRPENFPYEAIRSDYNRRLTNTYPGQSGDFYTRRQNDFNNYLHESVNSYYNTGRIPYV